MAKVVTTFTYDVTAAVLCHHIDGWMDGWIDGWMDGWMDGWIYGWMDG